MRKSRSILLFFSLVVGLGITGVRDSLAAESPEKAIRWIVPYSPGGGVDVLTRALAREVSEELDTTVIVQNIPGAGARIGTSFVERADPGYTLGTFVSGSLIIPQILFDDAPYDINNLVWVASPFSAPFGVWAKKDSKIKKIEDFKELGRPVWIGESSLTGSPVPSTVLLMRALGIDYEYVTGYGGQAVMNPAVIRGELDMFVRTYPSQRPWKEDVGSLLTIGRKRHPLGPDVPTVEEVAGAEVAEQVIPLGSGTYLVAASPGTSQERVAELEKAVLNALKSPRFQKWAKRAGFNNDIQEVGSEGAKEIVDNFVAMLEKNAGTLREVMKK